MTRVQREAALPWLVSAVLVIFWEFSCILLKVPEFVLPRPTQIAIVLVQNFGTLMFNAAHTLLTTSAGFGLAILFGGLLGILVGSSRLVYKGIYCPGPGYLVWYRGYSGGAYGIPSKFLSGCC